MNLAQIETNLQALVDSFNKQTFIYDLLAAYDFPKATINRLKMGGLNLSKIDDEIVWKKKMFFKVDESNDLHQLIDNLKTDERVLKHSPRFLIVTNFETLLAIDLKTADSLDTPINEIHKNAHFFLPWTGQEKYKQPTENLADVKAAERMAKLYDEIKKDNPIQTADDIHSLNVFLSRLLFCFFAEDTEIFTKAQFTDAISSHTQPDGSDLHTYLNSLFEVMNTEAKQRKNLPTYFDAFPYVNGGLFKDKIQAPTFTKHSRKILIDCGGLDWSAINPDIFGSMIQAVVTPEHRGGMGMHYTSVPNIMKVMEPLFLNELKEEFEASKYEPKKLTKLHERIGTLKIFDPACGSGNFLIIAYKELRSLEINILQQLQSLQKIATGFEPNQLELIPKAQQSLAASYQKAMFSRIELQQFYGIELDDFAHEIAILSLWLAQHQMNQKFKAVFGTANPTLPLKASGNILHGNATRLNWEKVCPKKDNDEVFVLGNPPYLGARVLDEVQKADMEFAFDGKINGYNDLDYISCWFYKGKEYIQNSNSQFAFVSTNSISQGSQVELIWPNIISDSIEIKFAQLPFKWENNAKANAGVTCVIIGLRNTSAKPKFIFNERFKSTAQNINAYLVDGKNIYIKSRSKPLSNIPEIKFGSMPNDGGYLILSEEEYLAELEKDKQIKPFIKQMLGGQDFIKGVVRYCIWIEDSQVNEAQKIPFIAKRINQVKSYRLSSKREATKKLASVAYRFGEVRHSDSELIIIPATSSERREYIPMGFLNAGTVVTNSTQAIYNVEPWHLSFVLSKIHMVWVRAVSGRLESRIRYSSELSYNTFPFPEINKEQKQELEKHVFNILAQREIHSEKTLAQLYDPDKMPEGLRQAHHQLDLAVDSCYRSRPFTNDEERLEHLFKLYEQMIAEEKAKGTLFPVELKTKKKKK